MKKESSLPFTGVKKNSSFMIDEKLERLAKDYALLKRMSYSAFVESLIREKVGPYAESLERFFKTELKPTGFSDAQMEQLVKDGILIKPPELKKVPVKDRPFKPSVPDNIKSVTKGKGKTKK